METKPGILPCPTFSLCSQVLSPRPVPRPRCCLGPRLVTTDTLGIPLVVTPATEPENLSLPQLRWPGFHGGWGGEGSLGKKGRPTMVGTSLSSPTVATRLPLAFLLCWEKVSSMEPRVPTIQQRAIQRVEQKFPLSLSSYIISLIFASWPAKPKVSSASPFREQVCQPMGRNRVFKTGGYRGNPGSSTSY